MVLKVYFDYYSQPSRAVVMMLKLHKIPFEENLVSVPKAETRSEWYKKINPLQRVPYIVEDDGFSLAESPAILRYLASKPDVPGHWYPASDPRKRALVDEYLAWQHVNMRRHALAWFGEKAFKPMITGNPIDEAALAEAAKDVEESLNLIEHHFLKDQAYLGGDEISVADLLGVSEMMQCCAFGYLVGCGRPKLQVWLDKVRTKLQPVFEEVHKPLMELGAPARK